ncbi:hypothetical protein CHS0354_014483 [Potamilus streckersoni]|uniref:Ras-associated and pleckstrin homology domains-containing protein 1 n=1 Tax=Potamilus streckersoni TaxID=2493646 RepID=A0AAE0S9T9_9BIVA|nr:hypothetical protein CHS0354_014483 [Potamilus streckersoni]
MEEEAEYNTSSEVEPDSDHDDQDAENELGNWLLQLETLKMGLDPGETGTVRRRNKTVVTPKMAMESFRLSFLSNDENQDVNFDAILGELCELETQLSTTQSEILRGQQKFTSQTTTKDENRDSGNDLAQAELEALASEITRTLGFGQSMPVGDINYFHDNYPGDLQVCADALYDIGETDSAFSEITSLPSSESFTSMVTVSSSADTSSSGETCSTSSASTITPQSVQQYEEEQKTLSKADKIRIALEKIKEAKIKKLFVRAFAKDGSSKSILVDEKMTIAEVIQILSDKNHIRLNTEMAVVEHMPELFMERILEDHDSLVENMVMWTRDSKNKVVFESRTEKNDLFKCPEKYLLVSSSSEKGASLDPKRRENLIQEFFSGQGVQVPEVEGVLYLKSDCKKAWKKFFFVLRSSGLYYNPKGKVSKALKDLTCLVQFDYVDIYRGLGWKKKYHSPTDYCFALKHPQIQKKTSKFIRYMCAENKAALDQWIMGIRVAKYGKQLLTNYENLQKNIQSWDMRDLRSSLCDNGDHISVELNPGGDLRDSRLSVPEPGARHSIVTVKNSSLVRKGSSDLNGPDEVLCLEVTPLEEKKSYSLQNSIDQYQKPPVKRVSFSNTHSVINADSYEELVPVRHRDSITSASTDSSEDSTSSGEGRQMISHRSKLRAKLPVTTETTRQISEMVQSSVEGTSTVTYESMYPEDRRSSLQSQLERRESDRRKSAPMLQNNLHSKENHVDRMSEHFRDQRTHAQNLQESNLPSSPTISRSGSQKTSKTKKVQSSQQQVQSSYKTHSRGSSISSVESSGSEHSYIFSPTSPQPGKSSSTPYISHPFIFPEHDYSQTVSTYPTSHIYNDIYQTVDQSGSPKQPPPTAQKPAGRKSQQGHSRNSSKSSLESVEESEPQVCVATAVDNKSVVMSPTIAKKNTHLLTVDVSGRQNSQCTLPPAAVSVPILQNVPSSPPVSIALPVSRMPGTPPVSVASLMPNCSPKTPVQLNSLPHMQSPPPPQYETGVSQTGGVTFPSCALAIPPVGVATSNYLPGTPPPVAMSLPHYPPGSSPAGSTGRPKPPTPPQSGRDPQKGPEPPGVSSPSLPPPHPVLVTSSFAPVPPPPSVEQISSPLPIHIHRGSSSGIPVVKPVTPPVVPDHSGPNRSQKHAKSGSAGSITVAMGNQPIQRSHSRAETDYATSPRSPSVPSPGLPAEEHNYAPLPFLEELNRRSQMQKVGFQKPPTGDTKIPPETLPKPIDRRQKNKSASSQNKHKQVNQGTVVTIVANSAPTLHQDCKRPGLPPPLPKRSETTKLSSDPRLSSAGEYDHVPNEQNDIYANCEGIMDINDLPPPPPELLEGLQDSLKQNGVSGKTKIPPPPPKRSKDTQLSTSH